MLASHLTQSHSNLIHTSLRTSLHTSLHSTPTAALEAERRVRDTMLEQQEVIRERERVAVAMERQNHLLSRRALQDAAQRERQDQRDSLRHIETSPERPRATPLYKRIHENYQQVEAGEQDRRTAILEELRERRKMPSLEASEVAYRPPPMPSRRPGRGNGGGGLKPLVPPRRFPVSKRYERAQGETKRRQDAEAQKVSRVHGLVAKRREYAQQLRNKRPDVPNVAVAAEGGARGEGGERGEGGQGGEEYDEYEDDEENEEGDAQLVLERQLQQLEQQLEQSEETDMQMDRPASEEEYDSPFMGSGLPHDPARGDDGLGGPQLQNVNDGDTEYEDSGGAAEAAEVAAMAETSEAAEVAETAASKLDESGPQLRFAAAPGKPRIAKRPWHMDRKQQKAKAPSPKPPAEERRPSPRRKETTRRAAPRSTTSTRVGGGPAVDEAQKSRGKTQRVIPGNTRTRVGKSASKTPRAIGVLRKQVDDHVKRADDAERALHQLTAGSTVSATSDEHGGPEVSGELTAPVHVDKHMEVTDMYADAVAKKLALLTALSQHKTKSKAN